MAGIGKKVRTKGGEGGRNKGEREKEKEEKKLENKTWK